MNLKGFIDTRADTLKNTLPSDIGLQRFVNASEQMLTKAVDERGVSRDQLDGPLKASAYSSMLAAASSGFVPGVHCAFIYYGGAHPAIVMIPTYKGIIYRAGKMPGIKLYPPQVVFEGNTYTEPVHTVAKGEYTVQFNHQMGDSTGSAFDDIIASYAVYEVDGHMGVCWCDKQTLRKTRSMCRSSNQESKGYKQRNDMWFNHAPEMAAKTAIHRAAKYIPFDAGFSDILEAGIAHESGC